MLVEDDGRSPRVDPAAWVAQTAVRCGDVRVAAGVRVLWNNAQLFGRHRDDGVVG
jgi:carbonic anhydrase/acetyltransferase-like protein (isoleucine patch superfamily)